MQDNLHQKATEIIGRIIELDEEQANKKIEEACKEDPELEEMVRELYQSIKEEDSETRIGEGSSNSKGFSKSRIGPDQKSKTRVIGNVTEFLFGKKLNRFVTLAVFLLLVFAVGFLIRYQYRQQIVEIERQEQLAMLKIHHKSLDQWISIQKGLLVMLSNDKTVVDIMRQLDSLVAKDPSYATLKNNPKSDEFFNTLEGLRAKYDIGFLSILNKRDPRVMMIIGAGLSDLNKKASDIRFGSKAYEYYLKIQDTKGFVFIPPMHDSDRFQEIPEGLSVSTFCSFVVPVYDQGELIGFLALDSDVDQEFSKLLNLSQHNETAETYAVSLDGTMVSKSRFEKELQKTVLLDNDSSKSSIHNIMMLDPGVNIFETDEPIMEMVDMNYTKIFAELYKNVTADSPVYEGSLMKPYNDYRGIEVIGTWKYLPEYNIGLISEIDVSEGFIALRYFDGAFYLFLILMTGLTILLYYSNVRLARFGKKIKDFQQLGQYRLNQKLGEGGFGQVYQAEHTFLKTPVAIKLLKKEFIGTDMLDRFQKEVKVTASLSNPNTVRVFDYGTSESGQFYYVMEHLNGITLDRIVDQSNEMPVSRVVHVLLQTCYSLAEAHSKGLIHRDVKPMNIMVCDQGGLYDTIKLLDFGLVKNVDTSVSQQTQINRIGGTPMFMAPERLRDPFHADHRVDIYAIGTVGLYMLSGQFLLELISQKMLSGQETLQGNFKQQLIERNDVPEELKTLLEQCISFAPDKRPKSVEEIIDELEKIRESYPWTRADAKLWWKNYDLYS